MLNNIFKPNHSYELLRVGSQNDGGYLVEKNSHEKSDYLIGVGINDDWSFEKNFGKNFIAIDDQISLKFLLKKFFLKLIFLVYKFNFNSTIKSFFKIFQYLNLKKKFFRATLTNYDNINLNRISLFWVINKFCKKSQNIFLKLDIEGSEYRVFDDIIKLQDKFEGIILEVHNIDIHLDKLIFFMENINLTLVHVHGNNYGGEDKNGDPLVIELTFSKNPIIKSETVSLPNNLDMPNNKLLPELKLNFK